ncbi:MAG: hypothetical protein ACM3KE_17515 [Hyphomicrobiales bacterium]
MAVNTDPGEAAVPSEGADGVGVVVSIANGGVEVAVGGRVPGAQAAHPRISIASSTVFAEAMA